jgi:hypothetical protein
MPNSETRLKKEFARCDRKERVLSESCNVLIATGYSEAQGLHIFPNLEFSFKLLTMTIPSWLSTVASIGMAIGPPLVYADQSVSMVRKKCVPFLSYAELIC